ncbi:MAG: ABC transporter permease [Lachnospiraceae bacterium]|nr:ABC transporter permease [Lachnospiraceae bacterium]
MTEEKSEKRLSGFGETFRRYRKSKLAMAGLIVFTIILFFAVGAGLFGTYKESITQHIMEKLQSPSSKHWFGTDAYGRDLFLRCIYGARISLIIGISSSALSMLGGCLIGMTAGFYGGRYDNIIMRVMDIFSSIPTILLAICIVAALGSDTINLIVALAISRIPAFARIARASVMGESGREYVEAAKAGGTRDARIMIRHIFPNILGPLLVQATTNVAQMILQTASLSFLGLGVEAPAPEWGAIISGAKGFMLLYPYMIWIPGLCIILASMSINLIGDGLRDALDPRLKT